MQLDIDYTKTIAQLQAKLRRQLDAATETKVQIEAFQHLQAEQQKATKK